MSSVGASLKVLGHVQGVGYRYYCHRAAQKLGLTGWVKNMPDGSVEAYVEGERGDIESLIVELKLGPPSSSVSDVQVKFEKFSGEFVDFQIRMTGSSW